MAKCWFCKTKKGKRYCAPVDNLLCPICCGKNRLQKIDCIETCRHLQGVEFQKQRDDEKEFSKLMNSVPHGQYDDIFQESGVALIAHDIEILICNIYMAEAIRITDKSVYESYKLIYKLYFDNKPPEEHQIDDLTKELVTLYANKIKMWELNMERNKIGQIFLRLMISVKHMSGGKFGEFGYLNYLKNNLGNINLDKGQFITEDKFGNKIAQQL